MHGGWQQPFLAMRFSENMSLVNPQIAELAGPQPIDYGLGAQTDILDGAAGSPIA
jgi:hypothetical protein